MGAIAIRRRVRPLRYLPVLLLALGSNSAGAQSFAAEAAMGFRDPLVDGRTCTLCPEMVPVAPGRFMLGSLPGEGHNDEHGPDQVPRAVEVRYGFAVSRNEISRREFAAFIQAHPGATAGPADRPCAGMVDGVFRRDAGIDWRSPGYPQQDDHPVVCVGWAEAVAYTRWLSRITGKQYRLLTEAEWEYVARGGSFTRYWWGNRIVPRMANCLGRACGEDFTGTVPPDTFEPNAFGLHNVLGNVWEWVQDCWNDSYNGAPKDGSAWLAGDCSRRVLRGGAWNSVAENLRSGKRESSTADRGSDSTGFRLVMEP